VARSTPKRLAVSALGTPFLSDSMIFSLRSSEYALMHPRYPAHLHRNLLSEYKGYEDEVQALQDQAKALERISEDIKEVKEALNQRHDGQVT
jgi:hypothetical protein